jgi:hypothetical protein
MDTKLSTNKTKTISLLTVAALVCSNFLTTSFGVPFQSAWLASGVTINVTNTDDVIADDGLCTLREAIIAANTNLPSGGMSGECHAGKPDANDIITLANGATYSLTIDSTGEDNAANGDLDILDNKAGMDLQIKVAKGGTATISQDASVDDRVLHILGGAKVRIDGLTLTGGTAGWSGGGIFNVGTLVVNHSTLSGNSAPNDGGGGIMNEGSLTITNSIIANNMANHDGGGIANTGTLTIDASDMFGNAGKGGGALANWPGGEAMIQNGTQVHDNSAGTGALFNYGTLTVIDSTVFNNTAEYGGGLSNWGGMLTLTNSTVFGNSASASAGGIHNKDGGTTTIENGSVISGNTAVWDGGGINNWVGTVNLSNSTVSGNYAAQSGGGILNLASGTVTVDVSSISNNSAFWGGGGINNAGVLTITGSALLDNTADGDGDAVDSATDTENATSITNSCIAGNGNTAVFNERSASQNFTANWWGAASGPSGAGSGSGDSVSDNVDFSSWLTMPPDLCPTVWVAAYTYDAGTWSEGQHNYHFEAVWNGGSETSNEVFFNVSDDAQPHDGYVLLRPGAVRVAPDCAAVDVIRPDQPTRFLAGYVTDYPMTYSEAQAYFDSLTASAVWDGGQPQELTGHEIIPYNSDDWPQYVCTFTADLILDASRPDWVNSGITVSTGQSFTIEAFGLMNPCSDTYPNGADYCIFYTPLGAEGVVPYENEFGIFPGPGLRFMALLGRIGDGEPFYVGTGGTFTAEQTGTLWFTPNDNLRTDNQGAYSVLVRLEP